MEDQASFSQKKEKKKKKKKGDYMYRFDICFKKQIFVLHRNLAIYPGQYILKVTDKFSCQNLKKLKNCVQKLKTHTRSNYYIILLLF